MGVVLYSFTWLLFVFGVNETLIQAIIHSIAPFWLRIYPVGSAMFCPSVSVRVPFIAEGGLSMTGNRPFLEVRTVPGSGNALSVKGTVREEQVLVALRI